MIISKRAQDIIDQANRISCKVYAADNDATLEIFINETDITEDEKEYAFSQSTRLHPGIIGGLRIIVNTHNWF